jgi:hypothetical protein
MKAISAGMAIYKAGVIAVSAATKIWGVIQAAFNLIMDANPISLVVIAIAALVAGVILAYNKFKWFRDFVQAVWQVIKTIVVGTITAIWTGLKIYIDLIVKEWQFLWYAVKLAVIEPTKWIIDHIGGFVKEIGKLPGQIGKFFVGMWDGMKNGFKGAINYIIRAWNFVAKGLSFKVPSWVPIVGGDRWGLPTIPQLAKGGDITRAGRVLVGEKGPEFLDLPKGASVKPLSKAGGGAAPIVIQITVQGSVHSEDSLTKTILRGLRQEAIRNGGKLGFA